jgi:pyridoxamine 5'-phosphate oxidase
MTDIDPIDQFTAWYNAAIATEPNDPNACALATVDPHGRPDVRIVLMKAHDARGFVFYTNYHSSKGGQLAAQPAAALDFHWKTQRRQVRIRGLATPVAAAESDAYFATRPRASQLSAWASAQSAVLESRAAFDAALQAISAHYSDTVPRPPHWGGFRIAPDSIEFWEDRVGRQHDRTLFTREATGWTVTLLYP